MEKIYKSILDGEEAVDGRNSSNSARPNLPLTSSEKYIIVFRFAMFHIFVKDDKFKLFFFLIKNNFFSSSSS